MKIISKILTRIFLLAFVFLLVNLIYGCFKYDGVKNYMQILNEKDRDTSIWQVSISDPISIFWLFNTDTTNNENSNLEQDQKTIPDSTENEEEIEKIDTQDTSTGSNEMDPYDPEFEDEFNSFFWGNEDDQEWNKNDKVIDSSNDIITWDKTTSVWQQLLEKFNE